MAAYAHDNILPVCIVLRGTMLLFLVEIFDLTLKPRLGEKQSTMTPVNAVWRLDPA